VRPQKASLQYQETRTRDYTGLWQGLEIETVRFGNCRFFSLVGSALSFENMMIRTHRWACSRGCVISAISFHLYPLRHCHIPYDWAEVRPASVNARSVRH
jgi:hypothetical protein